MNAVRSRRQDATTGTSRVRSHFAELEAGFAREEGRLSSRTSIREWETRRRDSSALQVRSLGPLSSSTSSREIELNFELAASTCAPTTRFRNVGLAAEGGGASNPPEDAMFHEGGRG